MDASTQLRHDIIRRAKTIVVKVGTAVLTLPGGRLHRRRISHLAAQLQALRTAGKSVVLVSSGAVGAGVGELNLSERPEDLPGLQGAAAIGQPLLMRAWHDSFARLGTHVAQILVTRADFESRAGYLNIGNTIRALHSWNAIPVFNENDTVAVEELRFGDNDGLAALTTHMVGADLLILLSSVDGLLGPDGPLDVVDRVDSGVKGLVSTSMTALGRGGMGSKLEAVGRVTAAGEAVIIANGKKTDVLRRILSGEKEGTLFLPAGQRQSARLRWIGQAARPAGRIHVDAGAVEAVRKGKSLLPSGVVRIEGRFNKGDVVGLVGPEGSEFARGLASYPAVEAEKIRGLKTGQILGVLGSKPYDELIHRDYLVLV